MKLNDAVRQFHRWVAMAFTITVVTYVIVMTQGEPPPWVTYAPLLPLAMLLLTGVYLFVLPHATRWRGRRRSDEQRTT